VARWSVALVVMLVLAPAAARAQYDDWERAEDIERSGDDAGDAPPPADLEPVGGRVEDADDGDAEDDDAAEEDGDDAGGDDADGGHAGLLMGWAEIAFYVGRFDTGFGSTDLVGLSPLFGIGWYATDAVRVQAQMGLGLSFHSEVESPTSPVSAGTAFRFGNALLSADVGDFHEERGLRYRFGAGLTLPFADAGDTSERLALHMAIATRGAWSLWLWAPGRLSIVGLGQVETDLAESLVLAADAGVGLMFDVSEGGDDETAIPVQLAANLEYLIGTVALGLRAQGVYAPEPLLPDREALQVSVMPYGRIPVSETVFATAGFVLNLNQPYGFSFSEGGVWGLRVGIGGVL